VATQQQEDGLPTIGERQEEFNRSKDLPGCCRDVFRRGPPALSHGRTQVTVTAVGGEIVNSPVKNALLTIALPTGAVERTSVVTVTVPDSPTGTDPSFQLTVRVSRL
jgi:hypothetical protein